MKRRELLTLGTTGLVALISGQNCLDWLVRRTQDEGPINSGEYEHDVELPPEGESIYAQKIFAAAGNLDDENNMLIDGKYTTFECNRLNPMQVVVGFAKPFSRVSINGFWDKDLEVEGWGGGIVNYAKAIRNSRMILGYFADEDNTEWGYADAAPDNGIWQSGTIQLDVGYTPGRVFILEAKPREWTTAEVKIGKFYCE